MKHKSLLTSTLLAAPPLAVIISGCGGSSNGIFTPTPTAFPTNTAGPFPTNTPTVTPIAPYTQALKFTLGNGQNAVLRYTNNSQTTMAGLLLILPSQQNTLVKTRALTRPLAVGTYLVTGSFTPPGSFDLKSELEDTTFIFKGQLPSSTQDGTYTLTISGETDTGILPRLNYPTPTPTSG